MAESDLLCQKSMARTEEYLENILLPSLLSESAETGVLFVLSRVNSHMSWLETIELAQICTTTFAIIDTPERCWIFESPSFLSLLFCRKSLRLEWSLASS